MRKFKRNSFEFFRFLLSPVQSQLSLFETSPDREQVIKELFGKIQTFNFNNHSTNCALQIKQIIGNVAYARLGRKSTKLIRKSPEQGFEEQRIEDWPGCDVLINMSNEHENGKTNETGQLIAVQVNDVEMQSRSSILESFAQKMNKELEPKGFALSINPIPSEQTEFWSVVNKHKNKIKKVVLTYASPNLFNLNDDLEKDLKQANTDFNTTQTQIIFENKEGALNLSEDNRLLQETANYINLGGGSFKIQLKGNNKYISAQDKVKTKKVSFSYDGEITSDVLTSVIKELFGDREE